MKCINEGCVLIVNKDVEKRKLFIDISVSVVYFLYLKSIVVL